MKFTALLYRFGFAACILLIISCFLPWTHYADSRIPTEVQRSFTGFYSYENRYGKPGKLLVMIALITFVFMLLPKIWAKRANLFVAALGLGYAIKSYVLFTSCYNAYCPEKKAGLFLMMACVLILMAAALFPTLALKTEKKG